MILASILPNKIKIIYLCILVIALSTFISCSGGGDDSEIIQDIDTDPQNACDVIKNQLPFPPSVNIKGILAMANDAEAVYIYQYSQSVGGSILRILKSNNNTVTVLASNLGGLNGLEIDNTHIYWTEYNIASGTGQIKKTLKSGAGEPVILAENLPENLDGTTSGFDVFFPGGIALDENYLYWGEQVGGSAIRRISKEGGEVKDFARGEGFGYAELRVDANNIYVLHPAPDEDNDSLSLSSINKSNGTTTVLASDFTSSNQSYSNLELSNNTLYWAETVNNGKAFSFSLSTGTIATIKGSLFLPRNIFLIANDIYIASVDGIYKINSNGSEQLIPSCSNNPPFTINVDGSHIFIAEILSTTNSNGDRDVQLVKTKI